LGLGLCTLFGTGKQMSDSVSPFATGRRGARRSVRYGYDYI